MSYINTHMRAAFAEHELSCLVEGQNATVYHMGCPGTGVYSVYIAEFAGRLCLTGDTCFGPENSGGVVSNPGYGIGWFSGHLSQSYLCEKFLRQCWQWEAAIETMKCHIEDDDEDSWWVQKAEALQRFIACPGWKYDTPTEMEYYEAMVDLGHDGCELPGFDYPRAEAGWLCAAQQRFRELAAKTAAPTPAGEDAHLT